MKVLTATPFIGNMTSIATVVGKIDPKAIHMIKKTGPDLFRTIQPKRIPHRPPKNAEEITAGTPKGSVGEKLKAANGKSLSAWKTLSRPW